MSIISQHWATTHRRYSVWALGASTVLQIVWSVVPSGMPLWMVLTANALISGLGLIGSYLAQPDVIKTGGANAANQ